MNGTAMNDQLRAANVDTRIRMNLALGLPRDQKPTKGTSPFVEELLDAYCHPGVRRCAHLQANVAQTWTLCLPRTDLGWLCGKCSTTIAPAVRNDWLGDVEEQTCDRCRRYLPNQPLTVAMLRQDIFVIVASLCGACVTLACRHGGRLMGGDARDGDR